VKRKSIKTILSLVAGLALFVIMGTACTNEISAESLDGDGSGHFALIEKIAERFDLDIDEVTDFMEELKEERKVEMEERFEERLNEMVEDEKITLDQKKAILDKKEDMKAFREEMEDMTISEAREAMKEMKEEMREWAQENDLDLKHLFPGNDMEKFKQSGCGNPRQGFRR